MRTLWRDEDGAWRTTLRGRGVLADPRINKGTAFDDGERHDLGLTGLIPPAHFTLDDPVVRVYEQYPRQPDDLARNVTLNALHDRNEVLSYWLLTGHLSEMLPIAYTPTVGQAIEHYSHEYRRPRGIYLSVDHPELIEASLLALAACQSAMQARPTWLRPVPREPRAAAAPASVGPASGAGERS
jgi:malate dehydrogenase (oxaloacetate-decarboxylating)